MVDDTEVIEEDESTQLANPLGLDDGAIENMDLTDLEAQVDTQDTTEPDEDTNDDSDDTTDSTEDSTDESSDTETGTDESGSEQSDDTSESGQVPEEPDTGIFDVADKDVKAPKDKPEVKSKDKPKTEDTETDNSADTSDVDFEAEYKRVLAPFKANNKQIQVGSIDDAIALMKMGANYNKKMAGLKPNLRLMKMLENNDLLDEAKLNYLIDLDKRNPAAIQKLIKDSGMDPLDIDVDKDTEYQPNAYTVNDKEVELDAVLDDIRDTPAFQETVDVVGNKWDESSRREIVANPGIIKVINEHIASGVFAEITGIIESERMLGRLEGLSDIDAYTQVGKAIQAQGTVADKQPTQEANVSSTTTPKQSTDPQRTSRKKAASTTKATVKKSKPKGYNPLAISDEEFEKSAGSLYM